MLRKQNVFMRSKINKKVNPFFVVFISQPEDYNIKKTYWDFLL